MKDELFDRKIRELADSCTETPDVDVWSGIESGLRRRRTAFLWRKVLYGSAAAVAVFGLLLTVLHTNDADMVGNTVVAVAEQPVAQSSLSETHIIGRVSPLRNVPAVTAGVTYSGRTVPVPVTDRPVTVSVPKEEKEEVEKVEDIVLSDRLSIYDPEVQHDYIAMVSDRSSDMLERDAGRRPSFSISASGRMSPTNAVGNVDLSHPSYSWGQNIISGGYGVMPVYDIHHYFPVALGLELKYSFLKDRLGVGIGVNYTFLISTYEALIGMADGEAYQGSVKQSIHYIGVPLRFYFNILSGDRITFYADAGCMLERAVRMSYDITDLYSVRYRKDVDPSGVQWSVNVGLGFEYRFLDFMGLYVDPRLTYFFDCGQPYSVRTEQPLQFNLELGFRFHI